MSTEFLVTSFIVAASPGAGERAAIILDGAFVALSAKLALTNL